MFFVYVCPSIVVVISDVIWGERFFAPTFFYLFFYPRGVGVPCIVCSCLPLVFGWIEVDLFITTKGKCRGRF